MSDHSQDDWYPDNGMMGEQVRVANGGPQLSRYVPSEADLAHERPDKPGVEFLFRPGIWTEFLRHMDRERKRGFEEVGK